MAVEQKLYEALKDWSPLVDLINDRLYPVNIPQGAKLPAAVYYRVSGVPYNHLGAGYGLTKVRIRFDAWAGSYDQARLVAETLAAGIAAAAGLDKLIENIGPDWGDEITYRTSVDVICWQKGGFDYE